MKNVSARWRATLDRLLLPYVRLISTSVSDEARAVTDAVKVSVSDEARGVRELVTKSVVDEAQTLRELLTQSVVDESRAAREEARAARAATEAEMATVRTDVEGLRSDIVELTRMLRMQGDASDQVAEVLGRTLTRLSAEVETLAGMLENGALANGTASREA